MRKFWAYYRTSIADAFVYRAEGIIWMLNDTGPALVALIFWLAAFQTHSQIAGYGQGQMIIYYLLVMLINNLVNLEPHYYLAEEIRSGAYSNYLIKPISLIVYKLATSWAWRTVRSLFFLPLLFVLFKLFAPDFIADFSLPRVALLFLSLSAAFWLNFLLKMIMALTTVWLMEAGWMFFLFEMIYGLFSGEMIPLDILPPAVNQLNQFLPFKYLLYFPVSLFLGKVTAVREIIFGLGVSAAWLILFLWLYRRLRARSAKAYESYGG